MLTAHKCFGTAQFTVVNSHGLPLEEVWELHRKHNLGVRRVLPGKATLKNSQLQSALCKLWCTSQSTPADLRNSWSVARSAAFYDSCDGSIRFYVTWYDDAKFDNLTRKSINGLHFTTDSDSDAMIAVWLVYSCCTELDCSLNKQIGRQYSVSRRSQLRLTDWLNTTDVFLTTDRASDQDTSQTSRHHRNTLSFTIE